MGNVLQNDTSVVDAKDREYLELSCSTIYNDEYLSNIYRNLPNLDGIDDNEFIKRIKFKKSKLCSNNLSSSKTYHLMSVFTKKPENISIDNFQVLRLRYF